MASKKLALKEVKARLKRVLADLKAAEARAIAEQKGHDKRVAANQKNIAGLLERKTALEAKLAALEPPSV